MRYGTDEYFMNMSRADRLEKPYHTISVVMDERPGFSPEAARELICAMMEMGYLVQELTVEEFLSKNVSELGFLLVLPHAESVPAVCAEPIETFWKQGGRVLVLGGHLFGHLIEEGENAFEYVPLKAEELEQTAIDAATSGKMYPIVMEGFTPSYKVYKAPRISSFMREEQSIVHSTITATDEDLFCPQARNHGHGYGMGHINRFIPMIQAMGEGGRADGRRGAAVYMMLQDVVHRPRYFVDDNRLGYVKGTNRGGCAVGIGFTRQDILNVDGMRELLEELLGALQRGLFLFEAGSDRFVAKAHETIKLGTKVMNLTMDYYPIKVEFRVRKGDACVFAAVQENLAVTANFTDIAVEFDVPENGEYTVETSLWYQDALIDRMEHTLTVDDAYIGKPDEFVKVEGGKFMLDGEEWRALGINYWPLYCTGFEWNDYWWGWLDKAYYDPLEIERDLELLESMGLNCLLTRLDGDPIGRCEDTMKDFIRRCRRHGLKLMFSYCNATSALNYQGVAFKHFMEDTGLIGDPTLFAHDIGWEMGGKFYVLPKFVNQRDAAWEQWLIDQYGSIENAENDFGVPVDRTEYGQIIAPPFEQIVKAEGDWRIKVRAYKRFTIDYVSRKYHDATEDMRATDPNHLITSRTGGILRCSIALNCAVKHLDFTTPEGWQAPNDPRGEYYAYAIPLVMKLFSGGKPTVWAEYGLSSCEIGWRNFIWDYENLAPYEWGVKQQTQWYKQFFETHKDADINGTAPWWFPGGLRYSERSDCGFCNPDGTLRPCAEIYKELGKTFKEPHEKYAPDYYVTIDEDVYSATWARFLWGEDKPEDAKKPRDLNGIRLTEEIRGEVLKAVKEAKDNGKKVGFCTPGTGTTSATMPMVAIGNVPLNGINPPRYLNAEFNFFEMETANGERVQVKNGSHIKTDVVRLRANVGNTGEATWLKPNGDEKGGVTLCADGPCTARAAITADTAFLEDAQTEWLTLSERGEYTLRMNATDVSPFGEIWRIILE